MRLSSLDSIARIAFAASCSERLFAAVTVWKDQNSANSIRKALSLAWSFIGAGMPEGNPELLVMELEQLLISEDAQGFSERDAREQDSIAAAIHTLRQITDLSFEHTVWAARQVTDSLDRQVLARLGPGLYDSEAEQLCMRDPALIREQSRQLRDLETVANQKLSAEIVNTLRIRAAMEGASLFDN